MTTLNLDKLSLLELKELHRDVSKALTGFEERRKREAWQALEEKAREFGFSVAELTGTKITRTRAPAVAKFANPNDPEQTWSGRGRQPKWYAEAIASGLPEGKLKLS